MTIVDSGLHRRNLASHVKYRSLLSMPERKDGVQERNGSVFRKLVSGEVSLQDGREGIVFMVLALRADLQSLSIWRKREI